MRKGITTPRIFTPPRAPLEPRSPETEARTFGYSAIDFAEQVCGIELLPWQQWLLVHALERENGQLRYKTVVVLVARQSGKSTLSQVLSLWSMYIYPFLVELERPMTILGTAQDLDTAEAVWEGALDIIEETPDLAEFAATPVKTNGKKAIRLLTGEQYKVKAASRKAGRGLSGDLIILDELREHTNWDAWAAVTKTTIARPNAQVWALSNAGDSFSVVLKHLRKMAHKALGDPDGIVAAENGPGAPDPVEVEEFLEDGVEAEDFTQDADTLGLFEWSATPGCQITDREQWAQANPSLGYGRVTERTLASAAATDPEWVFRTEVLCEWPDGAVTGIFPPGSWEETTNEPETLPDGTQQVADADRLVGPVWVGLDKSADRSQTWITFAGTRADGVAQVEVRAVRHGDDWVKDWLLTHEWRSRFQAVTGQTKGAPISDLIQDFADDPSFDIPVEPWHGGDLLAAHGQAFEDVRDGKARHNKQPPLDNAAALAERKELGDGWVIDRKRSPVDVAPLIAWIGALWLMKKRVQETPPPPAALALDDAALAEVGDRWEPADDLNTIGF
ncbi:MAG TPA: hypothetical protein K8W24_16070 [Brachybacterium paraconglomeratum]|uniref:Terminase n=1 Tax=Brachybacterium paraconglomeratum TaxID=173362 RepID=A0A921KRZ4_9MICO|nr:hypothetical protein [Brachybacterium paraconglomeratum]